MASDPHILPGYLSIVFKYMLGTSFAFIPLYLFLCFVSEFNISYEAKGQVQILLKKKRQ